MRNEFIELLKSQWDSAEILIRVRTPLPRVCQLLAVESFMSDHTGEAVDALRGQLLYLDEHGRLNFDG